MQTKSFTRYGGRIGAAFSSRSVSWHGTAYQRGSGSATDQGERVGPPRGVGLAGHAVAAAAWADPWRVGEVMRDLTDAQREQVKAIRERHAERLRPLVERARTARQALDSALLSPATPETFRR